MENDQHDTQAEIAETGTIAQKSKATAAVGSVDVEENESHGTESEIAAKKSKAAATESESHQKKVCVLRLLYITEEAILTLAGSDQY